MYTRLIYRLSGWLSLLIGLVCALSIYKIQYVPYGVGLAIIGFIFAGINIFLNQKFEFDEVKWPKGYIGMLLSSIPILFLLFVILKFKH